LTGGREREYKNIENKSPMTGLEITVRLRTLYIQNHHMLDIELFSLAMMLGMVLALIYIPAITNKVKILMLMERINK